MSHRKWYYKSHRVYFDFGKGGRSLFLLYWSTPRGVIAMSQQRRSLEFWPWKEKAHFLLRCLRSPGASGVNMDTLVRKQKNKSCFCRRFSPGERKENQPSFLVVGFTAPTPNRARKGSQLTTNNIAPISFQVKLTFFSLLFAAVGSWPARPTRRWPRGCTSTRTARPRENSGCRRSSPSTSSSSPTTSQTNTDW